MVNRTISTMSFAPRFPRPENLSDELFQYQLNEALTRFKPQFMNAGYLKEIDGKHLFRITAYVSALNDVDYNACLEQIGTHVRISSDE